jgi:gamma-glutamyltranspeptidase/glutathione hydrolase
MRFPLPSSVCPAAFFALVAVSSFAQPAPEAASGWHERAPSSAKREMIVAAHPLAAQAGARVLARGGSAVDAAIAAQWVLGLVEPQSSGIGGGGFMLVHDARRGRTIAYDGRETAPAGARPDRFLDAQGKPLAFIDAVVGGRSVGVPGLVAMLEHAHRRHGKLPWPLLFEPAIELAERGFAVSPRLATLVAGEKNLKQPRAAAYFRDASGAPLAVGAQLRNPAYARTLRALAAQGARALYRGEIARDIVATVAAAAPPGDLTLDDLARYEVVERNPVCAAYRRHRVCGMPLPSSGGPTVLQMLAFLEPFDVQAMGAASFWSVHFVSEAGRLAYADRAAFMADPAFVEPPPHLLNADYLRERGALMRPTATIGRAQPGDPMSRRASRAADVLALHQGPDLPSTTHVSAVDRFGNAVSMTTTIEDQFGSRLMTEGGFLLNNELTDFSFVAEENGRPVANRVEPGKRPRSSMAPTIVYDPQGRLFAVTGSPGGSSIINYVVKTVVAFIDWNLDPAAAAALPNFGSRNGPTELERGTPVAALAPKLAALGHEVRVIDLTSGVHAIVRRGGQWVGGADPRREGEARGR